MANLKRICIDDTCMTAGDISKEQMLEKLDMKEVGYSMTNCGGTTVEYTVLAREEATECKRTVMSTAPGGQASSVSEGITTLTPTPNDTVAEDEFIQPLFKFTNFVANGVSYGDVSARGNWYYGGADVTVELSEDLDLSFWVDGETGVAYPDLTEGTSISFDSLTVETVCYDTEWGMVIYASGLSEKEITIGSIIVTDDYGITVGEMYNATTTTDIDGNAAIVFKVDEPQREIGLWFDISDVTCDGTGTYFYSGSARYVPQEGEPAIITDIDIHGDGCFEVENIYTA